MNLQSVYWVLGVSALVTTSCVVDDPDHCKNKRGDESCASMEFCNSCISSQDNGGCVPGPDQPTPSCYSANGTMSASPETGAGNPTGTSDTSSEVTTVQTSDGAATGTSTGPAVADESSTTNQDAATDDATTEDGTTAGESCIDGMDNGSGALFQCSTWTQDCPNPEDKCMAWVSGGTWDATACFPPAPTPGEIGDACTMQPDSVNDTCGRESMCFFTNAQNVGECVAFCRCTLDDEACGDSSACVVFNTGTLALCLSLCDPFNSACAVLTTCAPSDASSEPAFICQPDVSGRTVVGDACEFTNVCPATTLCSPPDTVPGCTAARCCTSVCEVGGADLCPGGQSCHAWFSGGDGPPEQQDYGYCGTS
ncbi:MAG: hypothetical protein JKY37_27495 [Nannocystaceae bacterium]|nr:hypothetical protein [Nannocystaceae bacterium]